MTPHRMAERGIEVHVLPATATLEDVLAVDGPDGVFFSNGPGDPAADRPTRSRCCTPRWSAGCRYFGICFGNQLFGRALGFGTYKLKYGHRGINQPVMDRTTGKVEVTAHNHGFAVDGPTRLDSTTSRHPVRPGEGQPRLPQRRRRRGPGCRRTGLRAFTVQYHPEAAAGPHDAAYLFDRFCRPDGP